MKKISIVLALLLLLTSCTWQVSTQPETSQLKFDDQSQAIEAYQSMLDHYDKSNGADSFETFMPDSYGGCYINENNVLTICVVSPTKKLIKEYKSACGTEDIEIKAVEYSYAYLTEAMDYLADYNNKHGSLCLAWGIDEMSNRIEIDVMKSREEEAQYVSSQYPCIVYTVTEAVLELADDSSLLQGDSVIVELRSENVTVASERVEFEAKNTRNEEMCYSHIAHLEVQRDGQWYSIPYRDDVAFTMELPCIAAGGSVDIAELLEIRNYDYVPGHYRYGLLYASSTDYNHGKSFDHIAYCEFDIVD